MPMLAPALLFGKLVHAVTPRGGERGSAAGNAALVLCPDLYSRLKFRGEILMITGSDGKSSVAAMCAHMLRAAGKRVIANYRGTGHSGATTSELVAAARLSGVVDCDYLVLEADGRTSDAVLSLAKPSIVVVTDLLSAHGPDSARTEAVNGLLSRAVGENTRLVLNAMDPACSRLMPERERIYFDARDSLFFPRTCRNLVNDGRLCPACHHRLDYEYVLYHHIGRFSCPHCGISSPEARYSLTDFSLTEERCEVNGQSFRTSLASAHRFMNITAAVAAVCEALGCDVARAAELYSGFRMPDEFFTEHIYFGRRFVELLCRANNPVSFDRGLEYVAAQNETKTVLIYVNNKSNHGTVDVSWLYDVTFELLKDRAETFLCAGARAKDVAVRLSYAGIRPGGIRCAESDAALPTLIADTRGPVYVLAEPQDARSVMRAIHAGGLA